MTTQKHLIYLLRMQKSRAAVAYDVRLVEEDMADKGWLPVDLARHADVSHMTVGRFLRGERQTPRTAKKLAEALGRSVRRYRVQRGVAA